jgi:hypothetical protein
MKRWNAHTDIACGKAAKVLYTPCVKRLAYQTMVKPLMFYGTPAWHSSTEVNNKEYIHILYSW